MSLQIARTSWVEIDILVLEISYCAERRRCEAHFKRRLSLVSEQK